MSKKRILKKLGLTIGLVLIVVLYLNTSFYIERQNWKYSDGTYVGDWLQKGSFIVNDGIIETNKGKAKIIFCNGRELSIKSLQTPQKGYYINKD